MIYNYNQGDITTRFIPIENYIGTCPLCKRTARLYPLGDQYPQLSSAQIWRCQKCKISAQNKHQGYDPIRETTAYADYD